MSQKRGNDHVASSSSEPTAKKIKNEEQGDNASTEQDWKTKSIEEFKLKVSEKKKGQVSDQSEWKLYYEERKKAQQYHDDALEQSLGLSVKMRKQMADVLSANTKLSDDEKKAVCSQFILTLVDVDDDSDSDNTSYKHKVIAYSDCSIESVKLDYNYYFRARNHYDFERSLKYGYCKVPSKFKAAKTIWASNTTDGDDAEKRKYKFTKGALNRIKSLLFSKSIADKLTSYEVLELLRKSVGDHYGQQGHASSDDWIGYNNRKICDCPTEKDSTYKAPVFTKSRNSYDDEDDDDFVF